MHSCLEIIFKDNTIQIHQYCGEGVGVMNTIVDETLGKVKKCITKKNPALINVFGEMLNVKDPKQWKRKKWQ